MNGGVYIYGAPGLELGKGYLSGTVTFLGFNSGYGDFIMGYLLTSLKKGAYCCGFLLSRFGWVWLWMKLMSLKESFLCL